VLKIKSVSPSNDRYAIEFMVGIYAILLEELEIKFLLQFIKILINFACNGITPMA